MDMTDFHVGYVYVCVYIVMFVHQYHGIIAKLYEKKRDVGQPVPLHAPLILLYLYAFIG